jgi:hypothetical protein
MAKFFSLIPILGFLVATSLARSAPLAPVNRDFEVIVSYSASYELKLEALQNLLQDEPENKGLVKFAQSFPSRNDGFGINWSDLAAALIELGDTRAVAPLLAEIESRPSNDLLFYEAMIRFQTDAVLGISKKLSASERKSVQNELYLTLNRMLKTRPDSEASAHVVTALMRAGFDESNSARIARLIYSQLNHSSQTGPWSVVKSSVHALKVLKEYDLLADALMGNGIALDSLDAVRETILERNTIGDEINNSRFREVVEHLAKINSNQNIANLAKLNLEQAQSRREMEQFFVDLKAGTPAALAHLESIKNLFGQSQQVSSCSEQFE